MAKAANSVSLLKSRNYNGLYLEERIHGYPSWSNEIDTEMETETERETGNKSLYGINKQNEEYNCKEKMNKEINKKNQVNRKKEQEFIGNCRQFYNSSVKNSLPNNGDFMHLKINDKIVDIFDQRIIGGKNAPRNKYNYIDQHSNITLLPTTPNLKEEDGTEYVKKATASFIRSPEKDILATSVIYDCSLASIQTAHKSLSLKERSPSLDDTSHIQSYNRPVQSCSLNVNPKQAGISDRMEFCLRLTDSSVIDGTSQRPSGAGLSHSLRCQDITITPTRRSTNFNSVEFANVLDPHHGVITKDLFHEQLSHLLACLESILVSYLLG
ncbi:unnamed protein product [Protopolystoma xenopodis]|uniref:Uncharacterized protein n=1 Tax=Protopolystoma xenopodis TaxID=117903 RepID=A0A3S5BA27_9PLAT|nr:unnamed protein product [Protopolystoma xenopodis]